jgi:Fic family protein
MLENVFELEDSSWRKLIRTGFFINSIEGISLTSRKKKKEAIIQVLTNTENALSLINRCLDDYSQFTPEFLKKLHHTLLHDDWFEEEVVVSGDLFGDGTVIRLVTVGKFRKKACYTFHYEDEQENTLPEVTQFCHFSLIEEEMHNFCRSVQEILAVESDPFTKAAWIQWSFLRIHPFEDGNGRVSRIISSIPLYQLFLPPIVVKNENKKNYFQALKHADIEGDLTLLRTFLKNSLLDGMEEIKNLPVNTTGGAKKPERKRRIPGLTNS